MEVEFLELVYPYKFRIQLVNNICKLKHYRDIILMHAL